MGGTGGSIGTIKWPFMSSKNLSFSPLGKHHEREILYLVKIGGNVIDNEKSLYAFLEKFASIGHKKILVHGGGKIATSIGDKLGIVSHYIDGRRITDDATIDLVTMVYGGLVNKKIVAVLQALHCNAIGISGADANALPAIKRSVGSIDYGWAGDINKESIDPAVWRMLLENQLEPVVAPLTHDQAGHMLNTNADTIAAVLAMALAGTYEVNLIYCFERKGVLGDANDEGSTLATLDMNTYAQLKENKKLFAGIIPKIDNAMDAVRNGVQSVVIGNSDNVLQLVNGEGGTKICL
jgi:acetylglutamate kinase